LSTSKFPKGISLTNGTVYRGKYIFTADDGVLGSAVWASDGTPAGTRLVLDQKPGTDQDSAAGGFFVYGNSLLFSATDDRGGELWVVANDAPSANTDILAGAYNGAATLAVLENDSSIGGSLDQSSIVLASQPTNGTVSIDRSTGTIAYTAGQNFSGADLFSYTISDIAGRTSNTAWVQVLVPAPAGEHAGTTPGTPAPSPTPTPPASNSGSGGGGAISMWELAALFAMLFASRPAMLRVAVQTGLASRFRLDH
jgi:ELWxxDGT repeat protein